jgi:hypothetical protein
MRTTVVFILRLLVDDLDPHAVRGTLREVASGEERAFSSQQGLLDLLRLPPNRWGEAAQDVQNTLSRRIDP